MTKPVVFCSWRFPEPAISRLESVAEVRVWPGMEGAPREVLLENLADAHGVLAIPASDRLDAEAIARAPHLRVISGFGVGYDYVDVQEASRHGIVVCNTPGVLTAATADHTWALLLATARNIAQADRYVRRGDWRRYEPGLLLGMDLAGATLGIVGLGAIGSAVARRAAGFDMNLLYAGRNRKPDVEAATGARQVALDELLRQSDAICLTCALTPETRGLIGERELRLVKPASILVNTSRGAVVDQRALVAALQEERLAGAGLDVYEREPLSPDDPLLSLERVVLVPHLGSATHGTRSRMAGVAAENIVAALQGRRPPHVVNPEAWPAAAPGPSPAGGAT